MIGSEYQQKRIRIRAVALSGQRREGDSRCGVASRRLKNDVFGQLIKLTQLLGNDKAVLFIADDYRAFALDAVQTVNRRL